MTIKFNVREIELMRSAIDFMADERIRYASWIDDRPMLPAREEAVQKINDEYKELLNIQIKLYDIHIELATSQKA